MFIIPRLPKTQEEEYKVYPWASFLCFSAHKRGNAPDFYPVPCRHQLVLNLGHSPLYRHFCKCLYIELLKFRLLFNYWHIANPILSGRILKKSLQPLNILDKVFTLKNSNEFDSIRLIRLLVKNLPRYSHADRPCIFTVLMML